MFNKIKSWFYKTPAHVHDWEYYHTYHEIGDRLVPDCNRKCKCGKNQKLYVGFSKYLDGWRDR